MFKIFFIWFFLFCFSAFGEKAPETSKVVSKVVAPAKKVSKTVSKKTVSPKVVSKAVSKETVSSKEATQETTKAVAKKTVSPKEVSKTVSKEVVSSKGVSKAVSKETVPSGGEVKASVPSVESGQSSNISPSSALQGDSAGSFTYREALEHYREVAHLEWLGGIGYEIVNLILMVPVALELHIPITPIDPKLTGLLQAGGMFLYAPARTEWTDFGPILKPGGWGGTTVFQAGLKYSFSNQSYGSFKVGPLNLFTGPFPPNVWTGGLFFGFGSDSLTMEVGFQSFYNVNRGLWDFGLVFNMGSVLKKWWSAKH